MRNILLIVYFFSTVLIHASPTGWQAIFVQNFPEFNSISFKYIEERQFINISDGKAESDCKILGEINYIMNTSEFITSEYIFRKDGNTYVFDEKKESSYLEGKYTSSVRYGNDSTILNSKEDFSLLKDLKFDSVSQGFIQNSLLEIPDTTLIWMDYNYNSSYSLSYVKKFLEDKSLKYSLETKNNKKYLSIPEIGYLIDAETLLLCQVEDYGSSSEFADIQLIRKISFQSYEKFGVKYFPNLVVMEFYDENGHLYKKSRYRILSNTLSFNNVNRNTLNLIFPDGCHVVDESKDEDYIVTNLSSIKKKEDIINKILQENLNDANKQLDRINK